MFWNQVIKGSTKISFGVELLTMIRTVVSSLSAFALGILWSDRSHAHYIPISCVWLIAVVPAVYYLL